MNPAVKDYVNERFYPESGDGWIRDFRDGERAPSPVLSFKLPENVAFACAEHIG